MSGVKPPDTRDESAPFRLRGSTFHLVVLQINDVGTEAIITELDRLLKRAPAFLRNAPIIIGLDAIKRQAKDVDFEGLVAGLRRLNLFPIGVQGGRASVREAAAVAGLPILPAGADRGGEISAETMTVVVAPPPPAAEGIDASIEVSETKDAGDSESPATSTEPEHDEAATPTASESGHAAEPHVASRTMLITKPVRAGRQVYADKGADLIVTATVNPGAEIIADGNIHVYGALRGRAIAGAAGYEEARIFATHFDPELVAIAGLYRVREDLDPNLIGQSVQLSLDGENLRVDSLQNRS